MEKIKNNYNLLIGIVIVLIVVAIGLLIFYPDKEPTTEVDKPIKTTPEIINEEPVTENLSLKVGSTTYIDKLAPGYSYEVKNTSVLTVNSSGLVKAKKTGSTEIHIKSSTGQVVKIYSVTITKTVTEKKDVLVSKITLNTTKVNLEVGKTYKLEAAVTPKNATNQKINWSSNNPGVAKVSTSGLVTAVSSGEATIKAESDDGNTYTLVYVVVKEKVVECTIKFLYENGKEASKSVKKNKGTTLGTLPTVSKSGYTFKGWYTSKTGGEKVTSSTKVTGNMTLYARFKENETYTVGAGGAEYSRTITYMNRTFKEYKQDWINYSYKNGTVAKNGCGPVSLMNVLSGYQSVDIKGIVAKTGLSTSMYLISKAAEQYGLKHSAEIRFNSNGASEAEIAAQTKDAISHLKQGHQIIMLVKGNKSCKNGMCGALKWDTYATENHFIAIVGVKKDGETVLVLNPLEDKNTDGKMSDIFRYFQQNGLPRMYFYK